MNYADLTIFALALMELLDVDLEATHKHVEPDGRYALPTATNFQQLITTTRGDFITFITEIDPITH